MQTVDEGLRHELILPPLSYPQWLGTSSGAPSNQRNISSILLRTRADTFMVDAGEGTVRQLMAANINPASIRRCGGSILLFFGISGGVLYLIEGYNIGLVH